MLVPEDRLCIKCRHNLRNLPAEGFCPECRTPIRESAPLTIAPGQKVTDDRPCLTCGYNLKGIETAGNCPECGTPAARSLRGFLLRYSSREYLATLSAGALMVEASLILLIVASVGAYVTNIVFMATGMSATPASPVAPGGLTPAPAGAGLHRTFEAAMGLAFFLFDISNLWGWWMIST